MANPKVHPYMEFLPVDAGDDLTCAHQGQRWLHDLDADLTTPMIRQMGHDFYIFEPSILSDQSFCIPIRWFRRGQTLMAKAWRIHPVQQLTGVGWVVHQHEEFETSICNITVSLLFFIATFHKRGVPDPRLILGVYSINLGVTVADIS